MLHNKCRSIVDALTGRLEIELIDELTLEILTYINVEEGLVIVPQICIVKDSSKICLTRADIDKMSIEEIISKINEYCT